MLEIAPTTDKVRKDQLRWLRYVQGRLMSASLRMRMGSKLVATTKFDLLAVNLIGGLTLNRLNRKSDSCC